MKCPQFTGPDLEFQSDGWLVVETPTLGDCWYETIALEEVQDALKHTAGLKASGNKIPDLIRSRVTPQIVVDHNSKVIKTDKVVIARALGLREELQEWFYDDANMDKVPIFPKVDKDFGNPTVAQLFELGLIDDISEEDQAFAIAKSGKDFPQAYGALSGKKRFWATLFDSVAYTLIYPDTAIYHISVSKGTPPYFRQQIGDPATTTKCFVQLNQIWNRGVKTKSGKSPQIAKTAVKPPVLTLQVSLASTKELISTATTVKDIYRQYFGFRGGYTTEELLNISGGAGMIQSSSSHFSPLFWNEEIGVSSKGETLEEYRKRNAL